MQRIKKGDNVIIIAGKSKRHVGTVMSRAGDKVIVEGANLIKKHVKPNPQLDQKGGIITREAPVHISNVSLYNPITKAADKVGFKFIEKEGVSQKVRYYKSNDEVVDFT